MTDPRDESPKGRLRSMPWLPTVPYEPHRIVRARQKANLTLDEFTDVVVVLAKARGWDDGTRHLDRAQTHALLTELEAGMHKSVSPYVAELVNVATDTEAIDLVDNKATAALWWERTRAKDPA